MTTVQIGEVSRRGGWRGSPNSIAALLRCQLPHAQQRKCKRCGKLAVRGYATCVRHMGRAAARVRSPAQGRGERRLLGRLERRGLLPLELLALPAWRDLAGLRLAVRAPMRLALLHAWDKRRAEPLNWAKVQRQALGLARGDQR